MEKFENAEQSRQSATDAEVQRTLDWIDEVEDHQGLHTLATVAKDLVKQIAALTAYRKPSADQAEQIDRAIEIFQAHIDEAGKIVGHKPDCKYCEASRLAITALRRMAGEGK